MKPIFLRPQKTKWILVLLGSVVFTLAGVLVINDNTVIKWTTIIFFGLCSTVSAINLIPGASYLYLNETGFEICSLFRKHKFEWRDISRLEIIKAANVQKIIVFNFVGDKAQKTNLSKSLSGYSAGVPDSYGLSYEDLADLMNSYRDQYAKSNGTATLY